MTDTFSGSAAEEIIIDKEDADFLSNVTNILARNGIFSWLDQGTLLGLIRERRLLPWDTDIDVSVWHDETVPKLKALLSEFKQIGYAISVDMESSGIQLSTPANKKRKLDITMYEKQADSAMRRWLVPREGIRALLLKFINLFIYADEAFLKTDTSLKTAVQGTIVGVIKRLVPGKMLSFTAEAAIKLKNSYLMKEIFLKTPMSYFQRFDILSINCVDYRIPVDSEKYLEFKYGKDWRVPKKEWVYWEDDGGVKGIN